MKLTALHRRILKAEPTVITRLINRKRYIRFESYPAMRLSRPTEEVVIMHGRPEKVRAAGSYENAMAVATRELAGMQKRIRAMKEKP